MNSITAMLMQQELAMNRVIRHDMGLSPRRGALYLAEIIMESALIVAAVQDRQTNTKQLTYGVAPEWVGESTARRIIKAWHAEGLIDFETDPSDRRPSSSDRRGR
jgi:hypothetical protein